LSFTLKAHDLATPQIAGGTKMLFPTSAPGGCLSTGQRRDTLKLALPLQWSRITPGVVKAPLTSNTKGSI
jgi:hypothetical protein